MSDLPKDPPPEAPPPEGEKQPPPDAEPSLFPTSESYLYWLSLIKESDPVLYNKIISLD